MYNIEDMTWPQGDTKFRFWVLEKYFMNERSKQFKYFWTQEEKFRSSKKPCNVLFIT